MELHVPDTTHGLDLGLEGAEVVVVSVVTALKQVLVASVSGVLVTHPTGRHKEKRREVSALEGYWVRHALILSHLNLILETRGS